MSTQFKPFIPTVKIPTLLVGICAPYNRLIDPTGYYNEFVSLARTANIDNDHTLFFRLRVIDAAYFISKGKLQEIENYCQEHSISRVIISESLSPQQERNLHDLLNCEIIDRTELILQIFEASAHSAEGKLQVAIAAYKHRKSRLSGKGVFMSQQMGAIGFRSGPGETAKEREARYLEHMIIGMRKKLIKLEQVRATQRKQRLAAQIPLFCLIGYTNAGKSSILNALTKSNTLVEDKLFATLDTTTRECYINGNKVGLLSDTVGFIQNLPHQLINAFKSTLNELEYADLLLQVVDISDPNWKTHIATTNKTIKELNINKPMVYLFNKIDLLTDPKQIETVIQDYQPYFLVSSKDEGGLDTFKRYLHEWKKN